jgi:hypothetical protein
MDIRTLDKSKEESSKESFLSGMAKKAARLCKIDKISRWSFLTAAAVGGGALIAAVLFPVVAVGAAILSSAAFTVSMAPLVVNMLVHDSAQSAQAVSTIANACATDEKNAAAAGAQHSQPGGPMAWAKQTQGFNPASNGNDPSAPETKEPPASPKLPDRKL